MDTTTVAVHVRPHGIGLDTASDIIVEALCISFENVQFEKSSEHDAGATITVTIQSQGERFDTDAELRSKVENLLRNTPLDVRSTETRYPQAEDAALSDSA